MDENEITLKTEELDKAEKNGEDFTAEELKTDDETGKGLPLKPERPKSLTALKIIAFTLCGLILFFTAVSLIVRSFYDIVEVDGSSMEETLKSGDVLYVSMNKTPTRGDIVIIDESKNDGSPHYIIKRVIAVGGDTIKWDKNEEGKYSVFVKYQEAEDYVVASGNYVSDKNRTSEMIEWLTEGEEYELSENEVFFMGDNRKVSNDSRYKEFRTCELSDIDGVVDEFAIKIKGFSTALYNFKISVRRFFGLAGASSVNAAVAVKGV